MGRVAHRLVVSFTAAMVFVASVNCFCHGAMAQSAAPAAKHSCCEKSDRHEKNSAPADHRNPACNHCRGLSVVSTLSKTADHSFDPFHVAIAPSFAANRPLISLECGNFELRGDFASILNPPTLLGLHCALTT
jgi:hypothetical protein